MKTELSTDRRHRLLLIGTTRPWIPPAVYGPIALGSIALAYQLGSPTPARAIACLLGGWVLASWLEYVGHRYSFHASQDTTLLHRTLGVINSGLHELHHKHPNQPNYVAAPLLLVLPLYLTILAIALVAAPDKPTALLVSAGAAWGYIVYEYCHYGAHFRAPRGRVSHALKRYHMAHHFADAYRGYGVSSPTWDWVFKTLPKR